MDGDTDAQSWGVGARESTVLFLAFLTVKKPGDRRWERIIASFVGLFNEEKRGSPFNYTGVWQRWIFLGAL